MGFWDIFTADDNKQSNSSIKQAQNNANKNAQSDINEGYNTGQSYLDTGYNTAQQNLNTGYQSAADALNQGLAANQDTYGQALSYWDPLYSMGTDALTAYGNIVADPYAAYQQSPGLDWQMQQGLDALNRQAAARGMLTSGNNTEDILKYSQGLAQQDYYNWLNSEMQLYNPYFGLTEGAAQGAANTLGQEAGANQNLYTNLATNAANWGNQSAANANQFGTNSASGSEAEAKLLADLATQQGQNNANYYASNQAANDQSSAAIWSAIMGLAGAGAGVAGAYLGAPTVNYNTIDPFQTTTAAAQ